MNKRELLDKIAYKINDEELVSELHRHLDVPEERDIVRNREDEVVVDFTEMPYGYEGIWIEDEHGEFHEEAAFIDKNQTIKNDL